VSAGVAAGQLIVPIQPRYPAIARAARVQGAVVVSALIGTDGRIASIRVLSGSPLLVAAATDAIQHARYRPWTLNGQPVEVETTINVVFSLSSN
jgi:protein TonB